MTHPVTAGRQAADPSLSTPTSGFTLLELLVVMAVITVLCCVLAPALTSSMEKARVAKVRGELQQIDVALTLYYADHQKFPPVRVSCNTAQREHWCELPSELVTARYLPSSSKKEVSSSMEDPFNPGHTYKYATPGPYYLNGMMQDDGFAVYVPDDFPICRSAGGAYQDSPASSLGWVVWSLGPRQTSAKALSSRAPLSGDTWYRGGGDNGVIARIHPRYGASFQTP